LKALPQRREAVAIELDGGLVEAHELLIQVALELEDAFLEAPTLER